MISLTPEPWQADGACHGEDAPHPDDFFPDHGGRDGALSTREAKKFCHTQCPVQLECFDYAVRTGQRYGIWGGVSLQNERATPAQLQRELKRFQTGGLEDVREEDEAVQAR